MVARTVTQVNKKTGKAEQLLELIRYKYDTNGFIMGHNHGWWAEDHPDLVRDDEIVMTGFIVATLHTQHLDRPEEIHTVQITGNGWSFIIGADGKPQTDVAGNYLLTPPPYDIPLPGSHDYAVLGHIRSGALDAEKDFHPHYIVHLNRMLNAAGARLIDGQSLLPTPKRICSSINSHMKFTPKKV